LATEENACFFAQNACRLFFGYLVVIEEGTTSKVHNFQNEHERLGLCTQKDSSTSYK
jgi:hypothetical protein